VIGAFELAQCPQLVAFVPEPSIQLAARPAPKGLAQPISAHVSTLPGYKALEAKAIMPTGPAETMNAGSTRTHGAVSSRLEKKQANSNQAPAYALAANPLISGAEETAAFQRESSPAAGYILYTRWEQVTTFSPARATSQEQGDQEQQGDVANRDGAGRLTHAAQARETTRITITRLILRVVPAGSSSTQPSAAPVDRGWFDSQL
jgi:hypothetical protein